MYRNEWDIKAREILNYLQTDIDTDTSALTRLLKRQCQAIWDRCVRKVNTFVVNANEEEIE